MSYINEMLIKSRYPDLYCWVNDNEIEKQWTDFLMKYKDNFKDYNGYLKIPRDRYQSVDELVHVLKAISIRGISNVHKSFVFSLYILLREIGVSDNKLSIEQTKKVLGFKRGSDSIDYLIKENGVLDKIGVTETKTMGISKQEGELYHKQDLKQKVKKIKYKSLTPEWRDYKKSIFDKGNFLVLNMPIFLYMLFHIKAIRVKGIYLYCYMLSKCITANKNYVLTPISENKMILETGLSDGTLEKYLSILQEYGLLEILRGQFFGDEYGDFSGGVINKEINKYKVITKLNSPDFND